MARRDQANPGRSRPPRTLLDDIRADADEAEAPDGVGSEGTLPASMQDRVVDEAGEDHATLLSCPCCPATHSPELMVRVDELAGPMVDELPPEVEYICSWCDQHGRRTGRIARDVP